jgi:hypothetical protein
MKLVMIQSHFSVSSFILDARRRPIFDHGGTSSDLESIRIDDSSSLNFRCCLFLPCGEPSNMHRCNPSEVASRHRWLVESSAHGTTVATILG